MPTEAIHWCRTCKRRLQPTENFRCYHCGQPVEPTPTVETVRTLAAQRAFEAYRNTLAELPADEVHAALGCMAGGPPQRTQVHEALLLLDNGSALLVTCRWDFDGRPEVIAAALERAKKEGQG